MHDAQYVDIYFFQYYISIAKKKKAKKNTKKNTKKNIVKMNITQHIYAQEINERVGYAQLEFLKDGQYISRQKMTQDKIRIGRDYRNDIVIKDLTVSRRQCLIMKKDDKFVLRNSSENNVTCLNDQIIKNKAEIKYGDIVRMGRVTFKFVDISELV